MLDVEVLPVAPDRWIAVIDTPSGPFSTEARSAIQVAADVDDAVIQVLGRAQPVRLLSPDGVLWDLEVAGRQVDPVQGDG